jgi:hypothetical protein
MEEKCSVCYEELTLENSVVTPCNHFFCSSCFFRWLQTKDTCPMCRYNTINRNNARENISSYSRDLLQLMIRGEEITQKNIVIIKENRDLLRKQEKIVDQITESQELEKKMIILLEKQHAEIKKQGTRIKDLRRKIRIKKIKEINLRKEKLRASGTVNF